MKNVVENMWLKFFLTPSLPWGLCIPGDGEDSDILRYKAYFVLSIFVD